MKGITVKTKHKIGDEFVRVNEHDHVALDRIETIDIHIGRNGHIYITYNLRSGHKHEEAT